MALIHANPGEVVDLRPLGNKLRQLKTAAIVKTKSFEAIRLVVLAGQQIPTHQVSGHMTLQCLEGRVSIGLGLSTIELNSGNWIYFGGSEPHSLKGVENSSLLLTNLFDN